MEYQSRIYSKKFVGESNRQAYVKLMKWLYENIISCENDIQGLTYKIDKEAEDSENQPPTYKLSIFVSLPESDVRERHCTICREAHNSWFLNDSVDCNSCNKKAYCKRMDDLMKEKKTFTGIKLKRLLEKNEKDREDN